MARFRYTWILLILCVHSGAKDYGEQKTIQLRSNFTSVQCCTDFCQRLPCISGKIFFLNNCLEQNCNTWKEWINWICSRSNSGGYYGIPRLLNIWTRFPPLSYPGSSCQSTQIIHVSLGSASGSIQIDIIISFLLMIDIAEWYPGEF